MALIVPETVKQSMNQARQAWNQLLVTGPANRARWTDEQMKQLGLHAELQKNLFNALERLIQANS